MRATASAWDAAANLLCVRLDSMGDVLMTTPAIRALKESRPGRGITLLTSPAGAEAAALSPEIDQVIVYEPPWMKATSPRADSHPDWAMTERLRSGRFDGAVIFTTYSQSPLPAALLCYLANIAPRLAHCRENPYQLLTDWVPDPEPQRELRHEVRRHLDLVANVGCRTEDERLSLHVPEEAVRRVGQLLTEAGLVDSKWLVIHPGASAPSRRYPPEGFAAVGRRLALEDGWQVVFTGSASERRLVEQVQAAMDAPSHSLAGQLSVAELAALIARARLLIANNSGPVHVACAVGTPVVDLYALTNPQHTPWGVPNHVLFHDVPCKYCYKSICPEEHHDCLRLVNPDDVVQAARALMVRAKLRAGEPCHQK